MPPRKNPIPELRKSAFNILKRNRIAFFIALALLVLGYILSFYSNSIFKADASWVAHSISVKNEGGITLMNQKEADVGIRGFLFAQTQFEAAYYQSRYETSIKQTLAALDTLKKMVSDNPSQTSRLKLLDSIIRYKIGLTNQLLQMKTGRSDSTSIHQNLLQLIPARDSVQAVADRFINGEENLLHERDQKLNKASALVSFIDLIVFIFTGLIFILSYRMLVAELNTRKENERKLKQYEEELQKKIQQLEISNEDLEQFAFIASHDLQEPLRKIQAFSDRLKVKYKTSLDGDGVEYIEKVQSASSRMSKMIKDLLEYSRLNEQKEIFEMVDLSKIMRTVLQDFEVNIQHKNASVKCFWLPAIEADAEQVSRLFSNLISNALKFTRTDVKPEIKISSEAVMGERIDGLIPNKKYYAIKISDNGIGFDEANLHKIFTLFKRLHGRSEYEGSGIGLAVCKKVVLYHKGRITAESSPGSGTTFIVYLPEAQRSI